MACGEVTAVEGVAFFGGGEAGVLADGPRASGVHGGVGTTEEGREARVGVEVVDVFEVGGGVVLLDRDLFGGSVVLRQWRITSTGRGCFANERLCSLRSFRFFSAHRLSKQVCSRQTKKAHRTQFGRLSLVAGTGEISNLDFLKDLSEVIDFASLDLFPNRNLPSSNIPFGKSI